MIPMAIVSLLKGLLGNDLKVNELHQGYFDAIKCFHPQRLKAVSVCDEYVREPIMGDLNQDIVQLKMYIFGDKKWKLGYCKKCNKLYYSFVKEI